MKKHLEIMWQENLIMRGYHQIESTDTVIIVLHGIGGNKLGHKYIFKQFADACALDKISTIRVDFIGSGESDGNFSETTHTSQISQLESIVNYAKEFGYKNIILCSTTIGCYPLWHYACTDINIKKIINWNPITDFKKYKLEQLKSISTENTIDLHGLELGCEYIRDTSKLKEVIPNIHGDVLLIQGEFDNEAKSSHCKEVAKKNNWKMVTLENANHLFENNNSRDKLYKLTIDFVKCK